MRIGIDLVCISDFQKRLSAEGGQEKVFTETELERHDGAASRAGVFAAKEAFFKALGTKEDWHDVWVEKEKSGKPLLCSPLIGEGAADVSISHDGAYAIAVVVLS